MAGQEPPYIDPDQSTDMINKTLIASGRAPLPSLAPGAPPVAGTPPAPARPSLGVKDVVQSMSTPGAASGGRLPPADVGSGFDMGAPAPGKYQTSRFPKDEYEALQKIKRGGFSTRDLDKPYAEAQKQIIRGTQEVQAAQERLAETQGTVWELSRLREEQEADRHQRALEKANKEADDQQAENKALATELAGMKPKARNPYAENGGGKGVALVLLSAIAGAAAGLQGKENRSLDIINNNIESDYQKQKEAYERGERQLGEGRNLYREIAAKIQDEDQRHATFFQTNYIQAQQYLAQAHDRAQTEASRGELIKSLGLLENARLDREAQARQASAAAYYQKWKGVADIAGQQDLSVVEGPSGAKSAVGGLVYQGAGEPDPKTKRIIEDKWAAAQDVRDILKEAKILRKLKGTEFWDNDAIAKGKGLMGDLKLALTRFYTGEAKPSKELDKILGVPDDLLEVSGNVLGNTDRTMAKLEDMQNSVQGSLDNLLKTANYARENPDNWAKTDNGEPLREFSRQRIVQPPNVGE